MRCWQVSEFSLQLVRKAERREKSVTMQYKKWVSSESDVLVVHSEQQSILCAQSLKPLMSQYETRHCGALV
jgi:hypothetical protein